MYAKSNKGMVFKLEVLVEQGGKNEPLEIPAWLGLIYFKIFHLNLKKGNSTLNPLHIYAAVLTFHT